MLLYERIEVGSRKDVKASTEMTLSGINSGWQNSELNILCMKRFMEHFLCGFNSIVKKGVGEFKE